MLRTHIVRGEQETKSQNERSKGEVDEYRAFLVQFQQSTYKCTDDKRVSNCATTKQITDLVVKGSRGPEIF